MSKKFDEERRYSYQDHTFVICAYKESPYLENCIRSCLSQIEQGPICIATSTPNPHIRELAEHYRIPIFENTEHVGIAEDWNFALHCASTPLVTIAHQDDIYSGKYRKEVVDSANSGKNMLIAFSDYYELREQKKYGYETVKSNKLLKVKRLMLSPLKIKKLQSSRFVRRRILSMGSAICCPSVTLNMGVLKKLGSIFENNMRSNIDWQAWERISRLEGEFIYLPKPLMQHRIHTSSTTSELIGENGRRQEDLVMYRKFWPEAIARIIEFFYQNAEKSNNT